MGIKMISWNVNGLRACMQKGFMEYFRQADADVFCLQETKLQEGQITLELPGYYQYWNYAEKKGYSGTALFTKKEPLKVTYGIGVEEHDHEGRVITAEFDDYYVVTVFVPNSQRELARLHGVSTATIAVSLKKLEQGGYIERKVDVRDNRFNQICITPKGMAAVEKSAAIFEELERSMFQGFSSEDFERMGELLDRIYHNLEEYESGREREFKGQEGEDA